MTDPPRLLDGGDPTMSRLIRAGCDEMPAERAMDKTLSAIATGGAVIGAAKGAAGAAALTGQTPGLFLLKWIGIGMVAGGVAAGATTGVEHVDDELPLPAATDRSRSVPVVAAPTRRVELAPEQEPASPALIPELARSEGQGPLRFKAAAPGALAHGRAKPDDERLEAALAAEVRLVDEARALLSRGQAADALAMLSRYEAERSTLHLRPEAHYLAMEAHLALKNAPAAVQLARELSTQYPNGPHAERARRILSDPDGSHRGWTKQEVR